MDKSGQEIMKKQWLALQEAQKKVLEIATEKVQLAEQAQRHVQNHMARLEELHRKFEKELAKSDPEGLQDVLGGHGVQREHQAQALPRKKKQPVRFDLVGKWIAIEYDDEAAKACTLMGNCSVHSRWTTLIASYVSPSRCTRWDRRRLALRMSLPKVSRITS